MERTLTERAALIDSASRTLVRRASVGDGAALLALHRAALALDRRTRAAGTMAHNSGMSLADLGRLLGIGRHAARDRFNARLDDDMHPLAQRSEQRAAAEREALDVLHRLGGSASTGQIAAAMGRNPSTVSDFLRALTRQGHVRRTGARHTSRYHLIEARGREVAM